MDNQRTDERLHAQITLAVDGIPVPPGPNQLRAARGHRSRLPILLAAVGLVSVLVVTGVSVEALRTGGERPTPETDAWRWAGPEVALAGRTSGVIFERAGPVVTNAPAKTMRIRARCVGCASAALLEFDAVTPAVRYELNPGIAESINASVVFPAEGTWSFEPFGGQIIVRSPTSTQPPVVVVSPGSQAFTADCGTTQIENAVARYAQAFNAGRPSDLAQSLNPAVDFSVSGQPLATFAAKTRDAVGDYIRTRYLAGETIYPYVVYAHSIGANAVDVLVYFVRMAPDLPSSSGGYGYRRAAAVSQLFCDDRLLLRFHAGLLSD